MVHRKAATVPGETPDDDDDDNGDYDDGHNKGSSKGDSESKCNENGILCLISRSNVKYL